LAANLLPGKGIDMITDAYLLVCDQLASIRAAATYTSNNTIDLSVNRDLGVAPLKVLYNVDVAFAGGTSVQPQIITSAAANLGSPTVIDGGNTILLAALTLGAMFIRDLPELTGPSGVGTTGQRYLGIQFVGVGVFTLGTISARLVKDTQDVKHYASGYTIL
jgi:hypothetical protein